MDDGTLHLSSLCIRLLVLALFLPFAHALSFDAPSRVFLNESFTVTLRDPPSRASSYDVKLFIHEADTVLSQVYHNGWKSSFYYLPDALPATTSFTLRATLPASNASLCLRVRTAGKQSFEAYCQPITIDASPPSLSLGNQSQALIKLGSSAVAPSLVRSKEGRMQRNLGISTLVLSTLVLLSVLSRSLIYKRRI